MSKIICDICGSEYDDSVGACPVCGWDQSGDLPEDIEDFDSDFLDVIQEEAAAPVVAAPVVPAEPAPKSKVAFDYDAANRRARPAPKKPAPPMEDEDDEEDEEEEESGSNAFLVIILVLLILALLAVSGYIGWTKIIKPRQAGNVDNKPRETITAQVNESTTPSIPTVTTVPTTEATEPGVPCTSLSLVGSMEKLTFKGQYWRLMVKAEPEDTTDKVVYTSGDESVVTIDEYGRVTAVGEGETTIVVTCGDKRLETPAVVSFQAETTEPTAATAPVAGTPAETTPIAVGGNTGAAGVLKLKKTDVTIGRRGVYITLELEGGIAAEDVRWTTSDSSVATVYNGNVTAIGKGLCVITAEYNGQTAQCVVRCKF